MLLRRLHHLVGDLQALDLNALVPTDYEEIVARVRSLEQSLAALESVVVSRAVSQISRQVRQLQVEHGGRRLRVHVGAGSSHLPGWVNIDAPPSGLGVNLARGIPLGSASVDLIFCSHLLEHLYYPVEAERLIADFFRILCPGGIARIIVPDAELCMQAYVAGDDEFFLRRVQLWSEWPKGRTALEDTLPYLGAHPDPGALYDTHRFGYDFVTLKKLLQRTGFVDIRRSSYMGSTRAELHVDDASAVARHEYNGRSFSLFVEASKP